MSITKQTTVWCDTCAKWVQEGGNAAGVRASARGRGWLRRGAKDYCGKVDALTAELERLVSDLNRWGAECARHACAHADAGLTVDVGRCIGERDAYVRAAGLLASALRVSPRAGEGGEVESTERMTEAELRAEALAEGRDFDADVEHTRQVMLDAVADFERGEP